ncbi:5'-3' exonuclease [Viridibacillus arvi]|uniref:5'-3' exonuclease n=1 Tax=Viridibacillus arvi TaxID=263475 RepID=UPI0034CDF32E
MEQLSLFDILHNTMEEESIFKYQDNWLLIDGDNLLNRCYYATALDPNRLMKAPDGRVVNGVSGFLRMMINLQKKLNAHVVVFFDEGKGFRKEIYPEYKEGRSEKPESLKSQFPIIREILEKSKISVYSSKLYEADDLIATFATKAKGQIYILSNDKDLYQMISENITIISRKGKDDVYITPQLFEEMYEGLVPNQMIDFKAIIGDNSDNIPGINGIGDKGAIKLLIEYKNLENILNAEEFPKALSRYKNKIIAGRKNAIFAKELTELVVDAPIEIKKAKIDEQELRIAINKLGLKQVEAVL